MAILSAGAPPARLAAGNAEGLGLTEQEIPAPRGFSMRTARASLLMILTLLLQGWVCGVARPLLASETKPTAEQAAEKAKGTATAEAGKDGFVLKSADGSSQIKFKAYLMTDARFWRDQNAPPATDTFELRRARPIFEGTIAKYFDFRLAPDFGEGKTVLQDAWLDWRFAPFIKLQAGKFKGPVGLERLQAASDTAFVERALPTNLVPNRDIGLAIHGDIKDGLVSYALGVFNGVADVGSADADTNNSKETAARVFFLPFRKTSIRSLQALGIGVAATTGVNADGTPASPGLPSYRTPGQQTFFSFLSDGKTLAATTIADGRRHRIAPQASWYLWRLGFLAEYVVSWQEVLIGTSDADLKNDAWQVTASIALTNDRPSYKGVAPKRAYDPSAHGWGAVELVARVGTLKVDDRAFPTFADPLVSARAARERGAGVNWYLTRNVRLMFDYIQTRFRGGDAGGDRQDERVILTRLQLAF